MSSATRRLLATVLFGGLLASCSLVENVIPPQQIADPLGLHDVPVTLEPSGSVAAVGPQATGAWSAELGPASIPDIDTDGVPGWFDPDAFHVDIGLRPTVTMTSALAVGGEAFSDAFVLENARLTGVSVEDGDGGARVEIDPVATPAGAAVALEKTGCTMTPLVTCDYAARSGLEAFVLPVAVEGAQLDALYAILSGGAPTNRVRGTFELAATGTAPGDAVITVTLDAPTGTLDP